MNESGKAKRFPGFERIFARESQTFAVERARILLWAVVVLYPAYWLLDAFVEPELRFRFLAIRSAVLVVYLAGLVVVYSRLARRWAEWTILIGAYASVAGISLIASDLGGFESNYFVGVIIVIFAVGYFMPWSAQRALQACVGFIGIYLAINWLRHGLSRASAAPMFFLIGTSVFTYLATIASLRSRRRDLSLRLRLEQANENLQELDRAKTAFFANVSHELRTPLTLMLGPVESLLHEAESDEKKTLLRAVLANTHRLHRHVNLLLDSAKLEAGQIKLETIDGDLSALLDDLVTASMPHAGRKGIRLETIGLDSIPEFAFDPDKVEMIAANLLSNALKFTPDGGRIVVTASANDDGVTVEVEDNGPGIPEEEREQIFDRFHQVDSSLTRREEGTGLGLTLARELARLHGGDLTVETEIGRGSLFRLTLPRETQAETERRQRPRRREDRLIRARSEALARREYKRRSRQRTLLADVRQPSSGSMSRRDAPADAPRVLIVDDNADLRSYMASELSDMYQITTASDGVEGLKTAVSSQPNLIIADVMMPGMNGYELCRRLRAEPMLKAIPVILVTAKAGSDAVVEGLGVGADDYVTKPFSMEELKARVAAQLRAKQIEKQLGERETRLAAIGRLTSAVVHDLRNALTLVTGYSDLAHSIAIGGGRQDELVADIEQVQVASQRLERMTNEILEFARGGGTVLDLVGVPAVEYLQGILDPLRRHLAGQGVELREQLDISSERIVELDPDRFARILENLLGNARDAMAGQMEDRTVYVRAFIENGRFQVRVADNGPGISEDRVALLFEPFATGKKSGTGLGLVTVRNLARAHGGRVDVEAKSPEGGAAFTVSIPMEGPLAPAEDELSDLTVPTTPPN